MPVTGATNFVGAMAISGIPPFSGFWSKLLIIIAAVMAGKFWYAFWAIVALQVVGVWLWIRYC